MKFKKGQRVKVVKFQLDNYITVGSEGIVIGHGAAYKQNTYIRYDKVGGKPAPKIDRFNNCYYTKNFRLQAIDWKSRFGE